MWLLCQLLLCRRHHPSNPRDTNLERTVPASSLFLFVCCCFAIAATQANHGELLWYVCASHKHARNPRLCNGRSWFLLRSSSHVLLREIRAPNLRDSDHLRFFFVFLNAMCPRKEKKKCTGTEKLQLSHRLLITCTAILFFSAVFIQLLPWWLAKLAPFFSA